MIFNTLKTTLVAAAVSLGAFAASTAPASAGNGYLVLDAPGISVGFGDRRNYRHRDRYRDGRGYRRNRCTPRRAVRKAARNGINRAHVIRVGRRGVVVAGRQWGERVVIGFGRNRHCPVRFVRAR